MNQRQFNAWVAQDQDTLRYKYVVNYAKQNRLNAEEAIEYAALTDLAGVA